MKKLFFLLSLCLTATLLSAQISKTVDISAGGLSAALTSTELSTVTDLTITGTMNSYDFYVIGNNMPKICSLDISSITISGNSIPSHTFFNKTTLVKVVLPKIITTIADDAFNNCTSLTSVSLPDSLIQIGNSAFSNCSSLSGQLVLPAKVSSVATDAFYGCGYTTCKSKALTPPTIYYNNYNDASLGNIKVVYVPAAAKASYQSSSTWANYIIIGGDEPSSVSVTLTSAGTLGDALLQKVENLKDVNKLIVSGPLNSTDFTLIQQNLPSLISLDLKYAQVKDIPASQFSGKVVLSEIVLPDSLQTLGTNVFSGCTSLLSINIPKKVTVIPSSAFSSCGSLYSVSIPSTVNTINSSAFSNCSSLQDISLPTSLQILGDQAFYYCSSIKSIVIPSGVTQISSYLFSNCIKLANIVLPDSITTIGSSAFNGCALTSIKLPDNIITINNGTFSSCPLNSIVLPSKLTTLGSSVFAGCPLDSIVFPSSLVTINSNAFSNCTSLKRIVCQQSTPPVLSSDPFGGVDKASCALVVPQWSANLYKLSTVWSLFTSVTTFNTAVKDLPISGALTLNNNVRPAGLPNVSVLNTGSLTVKGTAPFTTDKFIMENMLKSGYDNTYRNYYNISYSILINESPSLTANAVKLKFDIYGNTWYYLSFPFNVNVADISVSDSAQFVLRRYDGVTRAANGTGGNWKAMTKDSILQAGVGYIFQSNIASQLIVPATDETKNLLFVSDTYNISLKEYISSSIANMSWNYIGNPYPAYYDSRYIDFTAPITVWNGSSYTAISLTDDKYALKPNEAFFVQKPNDINKISFPPVGRQLTSDLSATVSSNAPAKVKNSISGDRELINLLLGNDTYTDKCRVVINPKASLTYELQCDASKFMSNQSDIPQLYSLGDDDTRYAINERPISDGIVRLGYYSGLRGTYTLSVSNLQTNDDQSVVLVDKLLKSETNLKESIYSFATEAGTYNDRFQLKITKVVTSINSLDVSQTHVTVINGSLVIYTQPKSKITIYALNGIKLYDFVADREQTRIPVTKGIYLVSIEGKTFKSVVF